MKCKKCDKSVNYLKFNYTEDGTVDYASGGFCDDCFCDPGFPFPDNSSLKQTFTVVHKTNKGVFCNSYSSREQAEMGAVNSLMDYIHEVDDKNFKEGIVQVLKSGRLNDAIHYYNMYCPNKMNVEIFKVEPPVDSYTVKHRFDMLMGVWEEELMGKKV